MRQANPGKRSKFERHIQYILVVNQSNSKSSKAETFS